MIDIGNSSGWGIYPLLFLVFLYFHFHIGLVVITVNYLRILAIYCLPSSGVSNSPNPDPRACEHSSKRDNSYQKNASTHAPHKTKIEYYHICQGAAQSLFFRYDSPKACKWPYGWWDVFPQYNPFPHNRSSVSVSLLYHYLQRKYPDKQPYFVSSILPLTSKSRQAAYTEVNTSSCPSYSMCKIYVQREQLLHTDRYCVERTPHSILSRPLQLYKLSVKLSFLHVFISCASDLLLYTHTAISNPLSWVVLDSFIMWKLEKKIPCKYEFLFFFTFDLTICDSGFYQYPWFDRFTLHYLGLLI